MSASAQTFRSAIFNMNAWPERTGVPASVNQGSSMTSELLEIICLLPVRSIGQPCPTCRGPLQRSWNRPSDRVVSKFLLVQRFACRGQDCRWEGLLRVDIAPDGIVAGLRADAPTVSGTPIASMARKVIARWLFPDAGT